MHMLDKLKDDIREQLESSGMAVVTLERFSRACEDIFSGICLSDRLRLFCKDEEWSYEINLEAGELYITTGGGNAS